MEKNTSETIEKILRELQDIKIIIQDAMNDDGKKEVEIKK